MGEAAHCSAHLMKLSHTQEVESYVEGADHLGAQTNVQEGHRRAKVMEKSTGTWTELNDKLRDATEEACEALLKVETEGSNRPRFLKRIHNRYNKLRRLREVEQLTEAPKTRKRK